MRLHQSFHAGRSTRVFWSVMALVAIAASADAALAGQPQASGQVYLPLVMQSGTNSKWVSAYYVGYQRDMLPTDQIDWSTLTHLIVGRITPTASGDVTTNFDIDDVQGPQMARDLAQRAHAAGRKAILMLGGAGEHDGFVGAASAQHRAAFVSNLVAAMDDFGYDGIDVDWEPIETADRSPLLALLGELRAARPSMLLTIPVNWVNINALDQVDGYYAQIAALVDQINIMTYDMASNWDGWDSWHFGPLYGATSTHPSSIDSSVRRFLAVGVPTGKLGIGVGFYGSCWRGVSQPRVALAGLNVSMGNSDNSMTYAAIAANYLSAATRTFDAEAKVPYLSSQAGVGPQSCNFISYEDADSIAAKGAYVHAQGLGGAIIWTIAEGHIASAPAGSRDPLMQAMKQAFLGP
jgi:chitinase